MSDESAELGLTRKHRHYVLWLVASMVLLNIVCRYPLYSLLPHGSDTFFTLELARSLEQEHYARWTMTAFSYFGLYPLSYPSGTPFAYAELQMMTGISWNAISLVFSLFFSILTVLGSFMLFRSFGLRDDLACVLSGLMGLSPLFMYFTYEQASGRGFLVPMFILGLFVVFWFNKNSWARFVFFSMFTFGAFAIHRSSFMVVMFEGIAGLVLFFSPYLPRVTQKRRAVVYAVSIIVGLTMVVWPCVPGLRDVFGDISEISSSFRMAEWEFRTGFLLSGDSLSVLLVNLGTNYIGSIGIILILFPLGLVALFPISRYYKEKDLFLIVTMLIFAPLLWKAQYIQLIVLPFAYLLAGLALERRKSLIAVIRDSLGGKRPLPRHNRVRVGRTRIPAVALFFVLCIVFSLLMFAHRSSIVEPQTNNRNWPTDSEVSLGVYLGVVSEDDKAAFVSASGLLDRRIRWFSGLDSPVTDATCLQASGYLDATTADFTFVAGGEWSFFGFLSSFYDVSRYYRLSGYVEDRSLYELSWSDIFGFYRLYFEDPDSALLYPKVSAQEAGIHYVVEINSMGDYVPNIYMGEGVMPSPFLRELSADSYVLFENDRYQAFLAVGVGSDV